MTRISERQFLRDLAGTTLDVDDASREPALDGLDLGQADLDGDGRIADSEEHAALFRVLDGADREGSARTISLPELRLELTAIAEGTGSRALTRRLRRPKDEVQYLGLTPNSTVTGRLAIGWLAVLAACGARRAEPQAADAAGSSAAAAAVAPRITTASDHDPAACPDSD